MFYLLQTINNQINDVEIFNLKQILDRQKYQHKYKFIELEDINNLSIDFKNAIPVGTLEFVGLFLNKFYNIKNLNPIEVPKCLRDERYLKRKYNIINKKDIPNKGEYFIKYVSKLKVFSHSGEVSFLNNNENEFSPYKKDGLYQLSEIINIKTEYRIMVLRDEIMGIKYYDGDCTIFPNVNLIKEMILKYSLDKNRPLAYTMDIAVLNNNDTCIIEIHPFVSVGLYGFFSSSIPYMYSWGIDYYKTINSKLEINN